MSQDLEKNKILAAILVAGIVAMLAGFVAKQVVHPKPLEKAVLEVDTSALEAATSGGAAAATGPEPVLALLEKADTKKGEALAKACLACHSFDKGGSAKIGPNLYGIVNNKQAHMDGFPYSDPIKDLGAKGGHWSYDNLNHFLWKPSAYAKGTKMTFPGLKKQQDRADVIGYLRTLADSPAALPSASDIAADAPKEDVSKAVPGAAANTATVGKKEEAKPAPHSPGSTVPTSPEGISRGSDKNPPVKDAEGNPVDTGKKPADEPTGGNGKTTNDSSPSAQPTAPQTTKPGSVNDKAAAPAPDATSGDAKK